MDDDEENKSGWQSVGRLREQGIDVLFVESPGDEVAVQRLREFDGMQLERILGHDAADDLGLAKP